MTRAVPYREEALRAAAQRLTVAGTPCGLAGVALKLTGKLSSVEEKADAGEAALRHLKKKGVPGPWDFGLALTAASNYPTPRWAACQHTLACQAADATGLVGLGLKAVQAVPVSNYEEERAAMGKAALEQLKSDPTLGANARLALKAAGTSSYPRPQRAIYETFLADPGGDPARVALQALEEIPTSNYGEERADAAEAFVSQLASNRPALQMGLAAARTSSYALPRRIVLEAALENDQVQKPQELAGLALAMLRAIPAGSYGEEGALAARSLLKSLQQVPQTAELAELGSVMVGTTGYQVPQRAMADAVLQVAARGGTRAEAARLAHAAVPTGSYSEEAADAAQAALKSMRGDPVADLALVAMETTSYPVPRNAMARVALEAMNAPGPPPMAELALRLLDAIPGSSYGEEAAQAGRAMARNLASRYSSSRDLLDRAAHTGDYSSEQVKALREAFVALKGRDDDRAEIKKMAEAVTRQAPSVTIEEREDAIIVGGVRVKVRKSDAQAPRA